MKYTEGYLENPTLWKDSLIEAFRMLHPRKQVDNPVMFVTYLSAILCTFLALLSFLYGKNYGFDVQISLGIWMIVFVGNFAEALAESRGKLQASALRKTQLEVFVNRFKDGFIQKIPSTDLQKGDIIICDSGDIIPADGEVIEGVATVDEAAITGESAPVIREPGRECSSIIAGTTVISDRLKIRVTSEKGKSFLEQMIFLIESKSHQKTPNENALQLLLTGLSVVLLIVVFSLKVFISFSLPLQNSESIGWLTLTAYIALFICLIPTTASALIKPCGIAAMDRLVRKNVIAKSSRSLEVAGDIDLLIMDKTGTITMGNRMATKFIPLAEVEAKELAQLSQLASLSDETPEGRSIVVLAKSQYGLRAESLDVANSVAIPFSATMRMSGIDFFDDAGKLQRQIRKGAVDAIRKHVEKLGGFYSSQIDSIVTSIAQQGATPILVSDDKKILGAIQLNDVIKDEIKTRCEMMRQMGIQTLMITGDNALTAATVAAECGVDDFIAEATPDVKLALIKNKQLAGYTVAMTGDGTNDAPALAQADVGVAMNTGTQTSRESGNMVDLDSNPTKLLDIVVIGKQVLMTRGGLSIFSFSSGLAKLFIIVTTILGGLSSQGEHPIGSLSMFNSMMFHSVQSAISSSLIFSALIILGFIPLALSGLTYRVRIPYSVLLKNVLIFGFGGFFFTLFGIKLIDSVFALFRS